jgi:hypothetical protein
MCEDFTLNFGDKRTGCCILTTHHLALPFSPGNFSSKTITHPPPTVLGPLQHFSVSLIEDKTERLLF